MNSKTSSLLKLHFVREDNVTVVNGSVQKSVYVLKKSTNTKQLEQTTRARKHHDTLMLSLTYRTIDIKNSP